MDNNRDILSDPIVDERRRVALPNAALQTQLLTASWCEAHGVCGAYINININITINININIDMNINITIKTTINININIVILILIY